MLKPRRVAYYYDDKTCTYQKARFTPRWYLETFLTYGIFSIVAIIGFGNFYGNNFSTTKEKNLRAENQQLLNNLDQVNQQIAEFEAVVNELFKRQNNLYSPIVGSSKINATVWEGGAGGTSKFGSMDPSIRTSIRLGRLNHQIGLLQASLKDARFKAELKTVSLSNMPSILPVNGKLISGFGFRSSPIHGGGHMHTGLDFACQIGTPVYASGDGIILTTGTPESGYGLQVEINHQNSYVTKYAHLSRIAVANGEKVKRGDIIGYSGNTGWSTGPHLHYEIIRDGVKIDPVDYFYSDLSPTTYLKQKNKVATKDNHQQGQGN